MRQKKRTGHESDDPLDLRRGFAYQFGMIIDIFVGVVAVLSAIISFFRGFIREVLTIAGVAGGIFAAIAFGPALAPTLRGWLGAGEEAEEPAKLFDLIPMSLIADIAAYGAVFIVVVIVISVISHFTAGAAKAVGLGPIDRTLGVIFGVVRALILLALLYLPFHLLMEQPTKDEYFGDSRSFFIIEKTSAFIASFLPDSEEVEETAQDKIRDKLKEQDLLKSDEDDKPRKELLELKSEGYQEKQRDSLDALIEGSSNGN